jgi:hypothetical protein
MSTVIRRRRGSRLSLSIYKMYELLTGRVEPLVPAYDGYATTGNRTNLLDYVDDNMRADWLANRDMLLEFWQSDTSDWDAWPEICLPWLYFGPRDREPWAQTHLMD